MLRDGILNPKSNLLGKWHKNISFNTPKQFNQPKIVKLWCGF